MTEEKIGARCSRCYRRGLTKVDWNVLKQQKVACDHCGSIHHVRPLKRGGCDVSWHANNQKKEKEDSK